MKTAGYNGKNTWKETSALQESHGSGWLLPFGLGRGSQRIGYSFIVG